MIRVQRNHDTGEATVRVSSPVRGADGAAVTKVDADEAVAVAAQLTGIPEDDLRRQTEWWARPIRHAHVIASAPPREGDIRHAHRGGHRVHEHPDSDLTGYSGPLEDR